MADDAKDRTRKATRTASRSAEPTETEPAEAETRDIPPGVYVAAEPLYVDGVLAAAVGDLVHRDNIIRHGWADKVTRIDHG